MNMMDWANNEVKIACKKCKVIAFNMFEWGHKGEVMKLIGEENE